MPATIVLIPAAGDGAWSWHLVADALHDRRRKVVAVDLPADDDTADLGEYVDTVVRAIGDRTELMVVGHSFGAFTAPLVCARVRVDVLVLLAPMIPVPGQPPMDWWASSGQPKAQDEAGTAGMDDQETYYHDGPPDLAAEAMQRARNHPSDRACRQPWPLELIPSVAGLHVCALARTMYVESIDGVVRRAAAVGVECQRLAMHARGGTPRAGLVLGYGAIATEQIEPGLQRLRDSFAD